MKKRIGVLVLTVLLAMGMCACQADVPPAETQQQIRQDFVEYLSERKEIFIENVEIEHYLGTYTDGAMALYMSGDGPYAMWEIEEEIAGIPFRFPSSQPLYIYHDATFMPIEEAYMLELITEKDVKKIHKRLEKLHNNK